MAKFLEFLNSEENENELAKDFNKDLIYNLRSEPLVGFVLKAFNIIESKYLKLVSWELITDESKFDSYKVNTKYIKNKKNKKFDKRLPIKESRFDLLKLKFKCATDEKTWFEDREVLLYKQIDNLYYIIEGNRYCPIYQLVDASVYNRKNYLTLKSQSSPIIIKRDVEEIKDVENNNYKIQYYRICLSKQKINILYFYLGLMGYENTIKFMQMVNIIKIEPFRKYNKEEEYCFMSNSNLYIKVIKYFFDNDTFTRYMVTALLYVMEDCETMDDLYNNEIWTAKLGALITKEDQEFDKKFYKGKSFLLTFHSFLDKITKDSLRLKSYNKSSTFALVRWMLRNFNELKMLDNMDIANKRIRFGEHMVAPLVRRLNQRKRKFVTDITSNKIKQYHVTDLINMDQDFVIKTISGSKSSLLKYDDTVNDCDLFTAIKFSLKGPNSIGENNSNSVSVNNRDIHPSYVGNLGLNFTSTSDPFISKEFLIKSEFTSHWDR